MVATVLLVEDDPTVSGVVEAYLRKAGYDAVVTSDGESALQQWVQRRPDVVVLDVMLPGMSGLDVLRRRRADDDTAAVIILSARGDEDDRLVGLDLGADDYMVKPFSPRELLGRIQALLRRVERLGATSLLPTRLRCGPLEVDLRSRSVIVGERPVTLTHREFDLLAYLMTHPGEAFSKEALMRRVWGWEFGDTSTVTVHVRRLREKIEVDPSDPALVLTVRGAGYRFDGGVTVDG
ncbi:DNA-binding response regulator [Humibacillus sp. DSM 29435]|uniref:response regulator transcription factor n=1 Tax=Humibacillus sp. DSM 29435 TaxID=1869167 RepID=UPI00087209E1|nr:response regulator transcription factor [Humibacillus sp. DSM 29435]OFE17260.1 DNA-binding response regulator [Humibacillus sp. DSM 29435]